MPSTRRHPGTLREKTRAFLWVLLLLPAVSCGSPPAGSPTSAPAGSRATPGISVTDGLGRTVTLPKPPAKIISLAPSVTEVLFLLGAGDSVTGVTTHCDWPAEARLKPRIGTLLNPNAEVILAAKPDIVIGSTAGNDRQAILRLEDLGLPVFVTAPRTIEGIYATVGQIAAVIGETARGTLILNNMKERIARIQDVVRNRPPIRAFFITWFEPLLAPGRRTFETDVLRLAGVESITSGIDEYYPRFSLEQLIARDPDVILTVRHEGYPLPDLRQVAGWRNLRAVQQGRVFVLGEVLQHPSPRFVEGLEELHRLLHPEGKR